MGGGEGEENDIRKAWISGCTVKKIKQQGKPWISECSVKKKRTQQQRKKKPWLPDNVLMNILLRCPAKSLLRFKSVSKHWLSLTLQPHFIETRQDRARNHLPPTFVICETLVNSPFVEYRDITADMNGSTVIRCCTLFKDGGEITENCLNHSCLYQWRTTRPCNGLMCLYDDKTGILVYNLATQESLPVPQPQGWGPRHLIVGFAFHSTTKEYRLLCRHGDNDDERLCYTFRYESLTVGCSSRSWRLIGDLNYVCGPLSVCVNNILYSIGGRIRRHPEIVSFDLFGDEKFRVIAPPKSERLDLYNAAVYELHGNVCLAYSEDCNSCRMDLWVLKDPRNHVWTLDYRIDGTRDMCTDCTSFVTVYQDKVLLRNHRGYVYSSDERQENWKGENLWCQPDVEFRIDVYVENLLPLKTLEKSVVSSTGNAM